MHTPVHHHAHSCIFGYPCAPLCTLLQHCVIICPYAPSCIPVCSCILIQPCIILHPPCTLIHLSACLCSFMQLPALCILNAPSCMPSHTHAAWCILAHNFAPLCIPLCAPAPSCTPTCMLVGHCAPSWPTPRACQFPAVLLVGTRAHWAPLSLQCSAQPEAVPPSPPSPQRLPQDIRAKPEEKAQLCPTPSPAQLRPPPEPGSAAVPLPQPALPPHPPDLCTTGK